MQEKEILIESIAPQDFFGVNNEKFKQIKDHFSKLKLVARGNVIKVFGEPDEIDHFEEKIEQLISHFNLYSSLNENQIDRMLQGNGEEILGELKGDEVLVFGTRGIKVKARTHNQRKMVSSSLLNDMVFAVGPAGTGKTYTAVALAVRALKNKEVRRIVLTRPAVEAGENLGFLPGDLKEKLDPYLRPLYDALRDMIPAEKLTHFLEIGVIEIAPLAFMRGRTLDHAYVILDEAQNTTTLQMKMFLTRMGKNAKFIITGDVTQVDLPGHQKSGLVESVALLKGVKGISFITLDERDVIRHRLVKRIIQAFDKNKLK
ncbi:MAG: phosphate starvation-inducible protein PhoH [Bacteroidetes bacterium]|nr:MAG: phosphate starvation-inducible protein PhoH [Bacteroidota bacterium]